MNALVPVFVAVLLAEIGGPLAIFGRERRNLAALAMLALVAVAAGSGWSVAQFLIAPARTLLVGLSLFFAGCAQFGRRNADPGARTITVSALTLYRSSAPFLAFAFSAWMNAPFSAAIGALAGVGMVAALGSVDFAVPPIVRLGAGLLLCFAGLFAALSGLRLV